MTTMHALQVHGRGGPERLAYAATRSAGPSSASGTHHPLRRGRRRLRADRLVRDGAAAEFVAIEARNLARKPRERDDAEAAAVAMPALTASQALLTHGGLGPGQSVLVLGTGGGVGSFAVQLAKAAGASVTAFARAWARERVLELGADAFIDADACPWTGDVLGQAWSIVRSEGCLVSVVGAPAASPQRRGDVRSLSFVVEPDGAALDGLGAHLADGPLRPIVGDVRPPAHGRAAFASKQSDGAIGKTALRVP